LLEVLVESRSKEIAWEDKENTTPSLTGSRGQRARVADREATAIT
jgi:hypothetical protein